MSEFHVQEFRNVESYLDLPSEIVSGLEVCMDSAFSAGAPPEIARRYMHGDQLLVGGTGQGLSYQALGYISTSIVSPKEVFGEDDFSDEPGGYLAAGGIAAAYQGRGLAYQGIRRSLEFVLNHRDTDFAFTRTQNPLVEGLVTFGFDRLVQQGAFASYVEERTIMRGAYGKMLTAVRPTSRKLNYDDLDYANGDAAILTWRFS